MACIVYLAVGMTNPGIATGEQACPDCRGEGTVCDQVQWSDGLGGVTCTCSLCDGRGRIDVVAELRRHKKRGLAAAEALAQLRRHVLCYLDTSDPKRGGHVRGMPGASPHASTWVDYLRREADATAVRLVAEIQEQQALDHEAGYHAELPPPYDCPLTNARRYCAACNPTSAGVPSYPRLPSARRPLRRTAR